MEVRMLAPEFFLTPSLREHLERRLRATFARMRKHIAEIVVRLSDLNVAGGGRDKVCQLSVSMPGRPEVVIREVQEDIYNAIDWAVKRAAYRAMRLVALVRKRQRPDVAGDGARGSEETHHG